MGQAVLEAARGGVLVVVVEGGGGVEGEGGSRFQVIIRDKDCGVVLVRLRLGLVPRFRVVRLAMGALDRRCS